MALLLGAILGWIYVRTRSLGLMMIAAAEAPTRLASHAKAR